MKKGFLIAAAALAAAALACFGLSKWFYYQGGMVMDGPGEFYQEIGEKVRLFENLAKGFLIAVIVILAIFGLILFFGRMREMKRKNQPKHPAFALLWLLGIPVQIVIDLGLISLGAMADMAIANPNAGSGHPAPAFTIITSVIAVIFTLIVPIGSIVLTIVRFNVLKKRYRSSISG